MTLTTAQRVLLRYAKEFSTKEQLDAYLQAHPKADRRKHTVKPQGSPAKAEPVPKTEPAEKPSSGGSQPKVVEKQPDISKLKKLGEGASRKVYEDGDTVVKVAKDKKSAGDNKQEAELSEKSELFAKITEHSPDYQWLRQEKLSPLKDLQKLAEHFGVSKKVQKAVYEIPVKTPWGSYSETHTVKGDWLMAATYAAEGAPPAKGLDKSLKKYMDALKKIKQDVPKLDVSDFGFVEQWGLDKEGNPKIADYGFGNR